MAVLTTYLASLPPGQTTVLVALAAMTPSFLVVLCGFGWAHGSHVRASR